MDSVIAKLEGSVFSMLESQEAPRIKICGLRQSEDIEYANRLRPDFIGFIFDPSKRRYVDPGDAAALRAELSPAIKAVGVFVDSEISDIIKIASAGTIDLVQLHGSEDNTYINELRSKLHAGIPIIKAFKVEAAEDIEKANSSSADYVLLDNGTGTGEVFDWTLLDGAAINKPFFLAGGLGPDNVKEAIHKFHPDVVDASSSLETDGYKDFKKMKKFINTVRAENRTFID